MIKSDHIKHHLRHLIAYQVVPDAVHFWERALKIRRSEGPIKINQKCQNNQYFLSDNDPHQVRYQIVEKKYAKSYDCTLKRIGNLSKNHSKRCNFYQKV